MFSIRKNIEKSKLISFAFSVFIIGILVLAGPVQGFSFSMGFDNNIISSGEIAELTIELNIDSGENLPIEMLVLELSGPELIVCKFKPDGSTISGCDGMTITPEILSEFGYGYGYGYFGQGHNFGYGYGYGYEKLRYIISIDSSLYEAGTYITKISAIIKGKVFSEEGDNLIIEQDSFGLAEIDNAGVSSSGSSGAGSSGGCATNWECSEWSECSSEGIQTRTCEKHFKHCYGGKSPDITRTCEQEAEQDDNSNLEETGFYKFIEENKENLQSFLSGVTGAVIGIPDSIWNYTVLILAILVLGLLFVIYLLQRYSK